MFGTDSVPSIFCGSILPPQMVTLAESLGGVESLVEIPWVQLIYRNLLFFVLKYFLQAQKHRNFFIENSTWWKIRKRGGWPTTSLSFVHSSKWRVFTCYCVHLFVYMLASNGISTLSMKFCLWNIMSSENFRPKIFLSEYVLTKTFHTNYLELKLMQTKIKQITVLHTVHS